MQTMSTPIHPICSLDKDDSGTRVNQKTFRGIVGFVSRPDILFNVCICIRFQSDPIESHLTTIKRIFRYLKGTTNLRLFYKKSPKYKLVEYCDADYAGMKLEKISTGGNNTFLGNNLISWSNKRQYTIGLSTIKAKCISITGCNTQFLWMKHQLEGYKFY